MTVGEDTNRWFVTTTRTDEYEVDDVGADFCQIFPSGALVFTNGTGQITFAYAPGTWKFVEYQD